MLGALATFRLSHLMTIERGPFAVFEFIREVLPGGKGSPKEWISCIFCFSLTASALICLVCHWAGVELEVGGWILHWLAFSAAALVINQTMMKEARKK